MGPESTSEVNVLDNGIEDQHDVSSMRQQFSKIVTWALVHGYPWVHAAHEGGGRNFCLYACPPYPLLHSTVL